MADTLREQIVDAFCDKCAIPGVAWLKPCSRETCALDRQKLADAILALPEIAAALKLLEQKKAQEKTIPCAVEDGETFTANYHYQEGEVK